MWDTHCLKLQKIKDVPKAPEAPADVKLLPEIRDLLATNQTTRRG